MTRRRRTATPTFQRPLTKVEVTGVASPRTSYLNSRLIHCAECGELGFRGLHKDDDGRYRCNDVDKCYLTRVEKTKILGERRQLNAKDTKKRAKHPK